MTLKLAEQLKQTLDQVVAFDGHPLQAADEEARHAYLAGLGMLLHVDGELHPEEKAFYGALCRTLLPETSLEELLQSAEQGPADEDTLTCLMDALRGDDHYALAFLLDGVMLIAADGELREEEWATLAAFRPLLGWDWQLFNAWSHYARVLATCEDQDRLNRVLGELPESLTAHLLYHRGLARKVEGPEEWDKEAVRGKTQGDALDLEAALEVLIRGEDPDARALRNHRAIWQVIRFDRHPLQEAELPDKLNYLKALALTMAADETIHPEETAWFGAIACTLVGQSMLASLLEWAQNPDLDNEITAMMATLKKEKDWQRVLILDSVMLAHADGELHQDEAELIGQLRALIGWDKDSFRDVYLWAVIVATAPDGPTLDMAMLEFGSQDHDYVLLTRGRAIKPVSPFLFSIKQEWKRCIEMGCPSDDFIKPENEDFLNPVAIDMLHEIGGLATKALIVVLKDENSKVRRAAAKALGQIGDLRATKPLINALKDGDSELCRAAARALGEIGDTRAIEPLLSFIRNNWRDDDLRAGTEALAKIGASAVEPLISHLSDGSDREEKAIAEALARIGDSRAFEPCLVILEKHNKYIKDEYDF